MGTDPIVSDSIVSGGNYGIIYGVASFWLFLVSSRYYTEDQREKSYTLCCFPKTRKTTALARTNQKMGKLQQQNSRCAFGADFDIIIIVLAGEIRKDDFLGTAFDLVIIDLAITLTSRSAEILPLFQRNERHVSDCAPVRAHCFSMHSFQPVVGLLLSA